MPVRTTITLRASVPSDPGCERRPSDCCLEARGAARGSSAQAAPPRRKQQRAGRGVLAVGACRRASHCPMSAFAALGVERHVRRDARRPAGPGQPPWQRWRRRRPGPYAGAGAATAGRRSRARRRCATASRRRPTRPTSRPVGSPQPAPPIPPTGRGGRGTNQPRASAPPAPVVELHRTQ
jgi:hypothetical protein